MIENREAIIVNEHRTLSREVISQLMRVNRGSRSALSPTRVRRILGEELTRFIILRHVLQFREYRNIGPEIQLPRRLQPRQLQRRRVLSIDERLRRLNELQGGASAQDDCSICLEPLRDCIRLPQCLHFFHRACLELWLHQDSCCPLCREQVFLNDN